MRPPVFEQMFKYCPTEWSYPWLYGYLTSHLGNYLRGNITRDTLTATFAQLEQLETIYMGRRNAGDSGPEAYRHLRETLIGRGHTDSVAAVDQASSRKP